MKLEFPQGFLWGTSTAAAQVETAFDHQWKGMESKDGFVLDRTTDHEHRREEDAEYIARLGSVYRCSMDWSKLQRAPFAPFDEETVAEYLDFFSSLRQKGVRIMLVLHHFAHPRWLEQAGGWLNEDNLPAFMDFVKQTADHFGELVSFWNTFNEPNVYALNAFFRGNFPPHQRSRSKAEKVLRYMGMAHDLAYKYLKIRFPGTPVGISFNTGYFKGLNLVGRIPAAYTDWWFHRYAAKPFRQVDFWGLSYYAYIPFNPFPINEVSKPGTLDKLGIRRDNMWGYFPEGLKIRIKEFHQRYKKPIFITENGICTEDSDKRIAAIKDYLKACHEAIGEGVDLMGYIHWSAWDNFEWDLGPTYRFGLVRVNTFTKERQITPAGLFYENITKSNAIEI
jgi:beta-glucosidase